MLETLRSGFHRLAVSIGDNRQHRLAADGSGSLNISFYTPGLRSAGQTSGLGSAFSHSTAETIPPHRFCFAFASSAGFALIWPVRPFCFVLTRL